MDTEKLFFWKNNQNKSDERQYLVKLKVIHKHLAIYIYIEVIYIP